MQSSPLTIVADENIPGLEQTFETLGRVIRKPGRTLSAEDVKGADILIVRSVTPVNERLLAGSAVKFVGTCTIGIDHLDTDYLDAAGIAWSNAPGCNANSVVEYVFAALAALKVDVLDAKVGVIACGNVGGAVYKKLCDLGVQTCVYDPFVDAQRCGHLTSLDEVLACDIVSVHAPLTVAGPEPTRHLLAAEQLAQLKVNACLISAGRGAVIDNQALLELLQVRSDLKVALDVWESEPTVNMALLDRVNLATPHIAGYSYDGKLKGTQMIFHSATAALAMDEGIKRSDSSVAEPQALIGPFGGTWLDVMNQIIVKAYDIRADDARMRQTLATCSDQQARDKAFDRLRKQYPQRREFFNYCVHESQFIEKQQAEKKPLSKVLAALGFQVLA